MPDLARDGFVVAERNRGFRVVEMSDADLDEICEIRLLLEVPSTVQVAKIIEPAVLDELSVIADEIVTAAAAGDLIDYLDSDRRFTSCSFPTWATAGIRPTQSRGEALARIGQRERFVGDHEFVFAGDSGLPLNGDALSSGYERALEAAGLRRLRFHNLRPSCPPPPAQLRTEPAQPRGGSRLRTPGLRSPANLGILGRTRPVRHSGHRETNAGSAVY